MSQKAQQNTMKKNTKLFLVFAVSLLAAAVALCGIFRHRKKAKPKPQKATVPNRESALKKDSAPNRESAGKTTASVKPAISDRPSASESCRPVRRRTHRKKRGHVYLALTASLLAAVLAGYSILQYIEPMKAMAKESFTGIGRIVEEHDEENPYRILDIVPSRAYYDVQTVDADGTVTDSKRYPFSMGTIGYLAEGQTTLAQELKTVFEENPAYLYYTRRADLYTSVISQPAIDSFPGLQYEEGYGGVHSGLTDANGWTLLFEEQEIDLAEPGGADLSGMSEGIFEGTWQKKQPDEDSEGYDFISLSQIDHGSAGTAGYQHNPNGDWHVIFSAADMSADDIELSDLYVAASVDAYDIGSYSEATGLYLLEEDGRYCYVGTVGQIVYGRSDEPAGGDHSGGTSGDGQEDGDGGSDNGGSGDSGNQDGEDKAGEEGENGGSDNGGTGEGSGDSGSDDSAEEGSGNGGSDDSAEEGNGNDGTGGEGASGASEPSAGGTSDSARNTLISGRWHRLVQVSDAGNGDSGDDSSSGGEDNGEGEGGSTGEDNGEGSSTGEDNGEGDGSSTGEDNGEGEGGGSTGEDNGEGEGGGSTGGDNGEGEGGSTGGDNGEGEGGGSAGGDNGEGEHETGSGSQAGDGRSTDDEEEIILNPDVQYYVVIFEPAGISAEDILAETENPSSETGTIYYIPEREEAVSTEDGAPRPYDAYDRVSAENGNGDGEETEEDGESDSGGISAVDIGGADSVDASFLYVGPGNGEYKLTASEEGAETLEVYNAPVYFRCRNNNNWIEKYVFSSLAGGDNERSSFRIEVETVRADEVTSDMIEEADLIYMESGFNTILNPSMYIEYIQASDGNWTDLGAGIASGIIRRVSDDLLPIIVDYDIVKDEEHYAGTNYQYVAKALLKQDLSTFYSEMNRKGNLMDNLKMNVDKDEEFPNKDDNDYNYVNKNVYMVNDETPLVSEDFHDTFDKDKTNRGFSDVIAAIKAENTTLSEEDQLSLSVSKAMAIQYIINYSVGIIGEFDDLRILELQPTANLTSDLHMVADDRDNAKLCWQTEAMQSAKQILSSKKSFDVSVDVKSVAQFNGEWQDINSEYDLIFIGLDGQSLNVSNDRYRSAVYNREELNGKVYHTGDDSGVGAYDGNDITAQKMMDLLEYMEAGYPVLVEDNCFRGGTAQRAYDDEINTKYIDEESVMYHFLKSAVTDERYKDRIFTISDTMSSAMFMTQLKISKPRIELQGEDGEEAPKVQRLSLDENNEYHGTIAYEVKDNKGEAYLGDTQVRLYADLNYDGIFGEEEEVSEYVNEGNVIDVTIEGMGPGIMPWKLEAADTGNLLRRDSVCGYFELSSSVPEEINVLQIANETGNIWVNLQKMYEETENSVLAYCLRGAESIANVAMEFETVTAEELNARLTENGEYLNQWDVVVLTLDDTASSGIVADAIETYADSGRSLLVCSQDAGGNRMGLDAELLGQMPESRTYVTLGANGADGYLRYAGLKREMFEPQTKLASEQVNEGTIAYYPYQLENRSFVCGANTALRASEYLLDFENNLKSETNTPYVTVWYTFGGSSTISAYGISPGDARNNYYCYSKGNVVYLGQAEYPYAYDAEAGEKPEGQEGTDECKFFVNALMAAYRAGVHRADVSIVAGFAVDSPQIQSISVPFDQEWVDESDDAAGILDNTVDVYFRFADSNIAMDKNLQISFYYENPEGDVSLEGIGEPVKATRFDSPIWTVTDNSLTLVGEEGLQAGKVYRIQAPVVALKADDTLNNADIYIVLRSSFRRGSRTYEVISGDSVALNRARLFLLE